MKFRPKNFVSHALLYVKFFPNFLMKIREDILKDCRRYFANTASILHTAVKGLTLLNKCYYFVSSILLFTLATLTKISLPTFVLDTPFIFVLFFEISSAAIGEKNLGPLEKLSTVVYIYR